MVKNIVSPKPNPWDLDCSGDVPLTKQEFASDCDVNVIIARCLKNGLPLPSVTAAPLYADVSEIGSYADCVRRVKSAEVAFMNLPAELRTKFDNSPSNLIAFLSDRRNLPAAIELGLVPKPAEPAQPAPVAAVSAAPTPK